MAFSIGEHLAKFLKPGQRIAQKVGGATWPDLMRFASKTTKARATKHQPQQDDAGWPFRSDSVRKTGGG